MKVNNVNLLIRPGNERLTDLSKVLKRVNPGEVVPAKALRIVKGAAILQIFGVRVRAEFPQGLPAPGESLNLLLKSKGAGGFLFSISSQGKAESFPRELQNLSLSLKGGVNYHELAKFIKTSSPGVFEIFAHLLGRSSLPTTKTTKSRNRFELYNKMIHRGLSSGAASFLSRMSLGGKMSLFLGELLDSLAHDGRHFDGSDFGEEIERFFKSENSDLLESYLKDLGQGGSGQGEFFLGQDESSLERVKYVWDDNSAIVEVELSVLGHIVAVIQKMEESLAIFFYAGGATLETLRARALDLNDSMADLGLGRVDVFYNDMEKTLEDVAGWARDFYSKSDLDVRV